MVDSDQIRAILFREGDMWVAQCLEYDIGAQASDLEALRERLDVALHCERRTSIEVTGVAFGGIPEAPRHFHDLWDRRSGAYTPSKASNKEHDLPNLKLALCA